MARGRSVEELVGRTFGRLTVEERASNDRHGNARWLCRCACGATSTPIASPLRRGLIISCGCAKVRFTADEQRAKELAKNHRRRAKLLNSGGGFTAAEVAALHRRQRGRCAEPSCRTRLGASFHRDHIVPLKLGGRNEIGNIQLLCRPCNMRKSSKHPASWARENGRLL